VVPHVTDFEAGVGPQAGREAPAALDPSRPAQPPVPAGDQPGPARARTDDQQRPPLTDDLPAPVPPPVRNEDRPRPSPPVQPPVGSTARYIHDYEGGDCFFLNPLNLAPNKATIEAFGTSPTPFAAFDEAFKKRNGFEPDISVRLVSEAQCPAVDFMKRNGIDPDRAPKLQLDTFNLRGSEPLNGTIDRPQGRHVEVVLVADDGYTHSLADYLKPDGANARFTFRFKQSGPQGSKPQLVIAIGSPQPLALLSTRQPVAADALFPLLLEEARTQGMTLDLAVKYLRLEG
jgi:serine/threonine-protein kinase